MNAKNVLEEVAKHVKVFDRIDFCGENLNEAQIPNLHLDRIDFRKSSLIGANMSNCSLIAANFSDANLIGANLSGSNLYGAIFHNCNLSDVDFSNAYIGGKYLDKVKLSDSLEVYAFNYDWQRGLSFMIKDCKNDFKVVLHGIFIYSFDKFEKYCNGRITDCKNLINYLKSI